MGFKVFIATACSLLCVTFTDCAAYRVSISPQHIRISKIKQNLTVMCKTEGIPLYGCQFTRFDDLAIPYPVLDLSQGPLSKPQPQDLDSALTNFWYSGRGLEYGDCGITMEIEHFKEWMLACRVHSHNNGWNYAWMDIHADSWSSIHSNLSAREVILLPGADVTLTANSQLYPYTYCHYELKPRLNLLNFNDGEKSLDNSEHAQYHGLGLNKGECGVKIVNVAEHDNGPTRFIIGNLNEKANDIKYVNIIIARPPNAPELEVAYEDDYIVAKCRARDGRPAANITWYMGEKIIRNDNIDDTLANPDDPWVWPWNTTTFTQKIRHKLHRSDHGKQLRCNVSHVGLKERVEAWHMVMLPDLVNTTTNSTSQPSDCGPLTILKSEVLILQIRKALAEAERAELEVKRAELEVKKVELEVGAARSRAHNAHEQLVFERHQRRLAMEKWTNTQSQQSANEQL